MWKWKSFRRDYVQLFFTKWSAVKSIPLHLLQHFDFQLAWALAINDTLHERIDFLFELEQFEVVLHWNGNHSPMALCLHVKCGAAFNGS